MTFAPAVPFALKSPDRCRAKRGIAPVRESEPRTVRGERRETMTDDAPLCDKFPTAGDFLLAHGNEGPDRFNPRYLAWARSLPEDKPLPPLFEFSLWIHAKVREFCAAHPDKCLRNWNGHPYTFQRHADFDAFLSGGAS